MTRLTSKAIEDFIRTFHKIPDNSNPITIGIHKKRVFLALSTWGNNSCVFNKKLISALEKTFSLKFEQVEAVEETVVMAQFLR